MEREYFFWIMGMMGSCFTAFAGLVFYLHKDNVRQLDNITKRTEEIASRSDRLFEQLSSRTDRLFEQVSLRTDALYEMFCDLIKETKTKWEK